MPRAPRKNLSIQSGWIDLLKQTPPPFPKVIWVTNGKKISLAYYIDDPKDFYGPDGPDDEDDKGSFGEEWHEPHYKFITEVGPFKAGLEYFGGMEEGDLTHWMPLPNLPWKNNAKTLT